MIEVLGRRNSANVQKVMWALGELGLQYKRHDVGGSFGYPDEYPSPSPVVPSLIDGDVVMWESNACVRYLARTYGQGTLWPDDPMELATADMWMDWQRSDISMAFFPLFQALVRGLEVGPDKVEKFQDNCIACFSQVDDRLHGREYICGDSLTIADISIGVMMYRYMTLDIRREELPNLQAWYQRLTEREAYRYHVMLPYCSNVEEWNAYEQANAGLQ